MFSSHLQELNWEMFMNLIYHCTLITNVYCLFGHRINVGQRLFFSISFQVECPSTSDFINAPLWSFSLDVITRKMGDVHSIYENIV